MDDSQSRPSSNDTNGTNRSVDDIVAAFRSAVGREQDRGGSDPTRPPEADDAGDDLAPEPAAEIEEETPPSSHDDVVDDTIVAFRKARPRSDEENEQVPRRGGRSRSRSVRDEKDDRSRGRDRSAGDDARTRSHGPAEEEPSEDIAPDFREALDRRSGSGHGRSANAEEPDRDESRPADQRESVSSGDDVEATDRAGDGVPSAGEVHVSEGAGGSGRPMQVDGSFLWVTDQPEEDAGSIAVENLGQPRAQEAEAFLLWGSGRAPYERLTRIRSHGRMSVYLKPVFWMHAPGDESRVAKHVDGEWMQDERRALNTLKDTASAINRRIRDVAGSEGREENGMELRVLRFMATRGHEFEPERTIRNSDGFVYPKLSPLLDRGGRQGGGELVQVLSMLEDRRLLTGEFVTRQHACQGCGSAFLNFEERCPNCGATHLETDDLVHHFRCAFTGPLGEYKKEKDRLVCPKCDRSLKQIGVDYDKPSVVHTCLRCQEEFQGPEVQTTCYQCGQTTPPERQVHRNVKTYELTALGEEAATYGLSDSLLSILERESRVLDYATFQLIVESEAARIERYQRSAASLLLVQVRGLQQVRRDLGQRSQEVVEEIATAFDNTLRSSDYLSARDESLYLFLLTETDEAGARRAGERLESNIEGVLTQNLEHPPDLDIGVQPLHPDVDLDGIAEQFLSSQPQERTPAERR